jgi:hypothetical protein
VCSSDGVFGLLSPVTRAAAKQFIVTRSGHVTQEKNKENNKYISCHSTCHHFPKIKQGGKNKSDKKEVRAEQKLLKPISLVLHLVLNNCSVRCVLILCKTNYLITGIARLVMSDVQQLTGWWRKLDESCSLIVTVTEHFLDDPI